MTTQNWLSIVDYSNKHDVSVSTLRRRIKSNRIKFRLDDGKYFLEDDQLSEAVNTKPTETAFVVEEETKIDTFKTAADDAFTTAKSLLDELKKSYSFILQEKEEQILQSRDEVVDLKTLVRVLEEDNKKLRQYINHLHEIKSSM